MAFAYRGSRMLMRELPKSNQTGLVKFAVSNTNPSVQLYRDMVREVPKIFTIYDINLPLKEVLGTIFISFQPFFELNFPVIVRIERDVRKLKA